MTNIIRIKNAAFYAYHGAMREEQNIGGRFEADVEIYTDFKRAAETDDLKYAINYHDVYKFINQIVHEEMYFLIETIAVKIADGILKNFDAAEKVIVRVRKHSVPVGGMLDCVEAEVIKEKNG